MLVFLPSLPSSGSLGDLACFKWSSLGGFLVVRRYVFEWMGCMRFGYHHPALPPAPSTRCLAPSDCEGPSSPDASLCSCCRLGVLVSSDPFSVSVARRVRGLPLGQCRGSGSALPIGPPAIPVIHPNIGSQAGLQTDEFGY